MVAAANGRTGLRGGVRGFFLFPGKTIRPLIRQEEKLILISSIPKCGFLPVPQEEKLKVQNPASIRKLYV